MEQLLKIIFYWLDGGILKPNQLLNRKFKNFKSALENRIKNPFSLSTDDQTGEIIVDIQLANGIVRMIVEKKRLFVSTGLTFIMWSIGSSVLLFSIWKVFLQLTIYFSLTHF